MSRKIIIIIVCAIILATGYLFYMEEQGNFHTITSGEAYRSAQLDQDELEYYVKNYNIKSILNLRGDDPTSSWNVEETKFSQENGLKYYNISLSAQSEPSMYNVDRLIKVFLDAPRPILIHCQYGADRSGLVAAMWKVIVDKEPKEIASKQLSIWFGHISIGPTAALDRFFWKWSPSPGISKQG